MKKIRKSESNILLIIAVLIYITLKIINRLILKIPDMVYVVLMFICIGIVFSAIKSQKQEK